MSNGMKYGLLVLLVVVAAGGAAYKLGVIPGLSEEAPTTARKAPTAPGGVGSDCPPAGGAGKGAPATGAPGTTPGSQPGTTPTPSPAPSTSGTPAPASPSTPAPGGAPTASGSPGYDADTLVAGAGDVIRDWSTSSDTPLHAQEPAAPATPSPGTTTQPGAAGAQPQAATPAPGTTPQPGAAGSTPGAAGQKSPCGTPEPGAAGGAARGATTPGTPGGAAPAAGAGGSAGAGAAAAGAAASPRLVSEDPNTGNSAYALQIAKVVAAVAQKNQLNFAVDVQLVPVAGGVTTNKPAIRKYRGTVTAAVLRIRVQDETSQQQWVASRKPVRAALVVNFSRLLGRFFPKAYRSVAIVGTDSNLLAIGDAPPGSSPRVTVYG